MYEKMKYFVSIVDLHSFTEAAYQNHISQSAISQQIKTLEEELQTKLIIRRNRSFELTPAGDYFYRHSKVLLQELEQIKAETKRRADKELSLIIGYPKKYEGEELQKTIFEFSAIYPEVNFSFVTGDHEELFQQLVADKIDMKLSEQRRMFNQDYFNYELAVANCYVELSINDELACKDQLDISDLKHKNCILVAGKEQRENEKEFYADILKVPSQFLYADSLSQARMMIMSNRGYLIVDEPGKLLPVPSGMKRIPLYHHDEKLQRNYFLCWKKERTSYYIEEFAEMFRKLLNQ